MELRTTRESILRDLWKRNAVRREAQLPLIDIKAELEREIRRKEEEEYFSARRELFEIGQVLEDKWIARRKRHDTSYVPSRTTTWHMMVGNHVNKVLERILRMRTGRVRPDWATDVIGYGEAAGKRDRDEEYE